jgi:hypothetical protein
MNLVTLGDNQEALIQPALPAVYLLCAVKGIKAWVKNGHTSKEHSSHYKMSMTFQLYVITPRNLGWCTSTQISNCLSLSPQDFILNGYIA